MGQPWLPAGSPQVVLHASCPSELCVFSQAAITEDCRQSSLDKCIVTWSWRVGV